MARFKYKAVAPTGSIVEGEMEAQARQAAIERLRELKHLPVRVEEISATPPPSPPAPPPPAPAPSPVPTAEVVRLREADSRIEPRFEPPPPPPPAPEPEPEPHHEPVIERLSLDTAGVAGSMEPILGGAFSPVQAPEPTADDQGRVEPSLDAGLGHQDEMSPEPAFDLPPAVAPEPASPPPDAEIDAAPDRPLRWDVGDGPEAASPPGPPAEARAADPRDEGWRDAGLAAITREAQRALHAEEREAGDTPARWLSEEDVRIRDALAADEPMVLDKPIEQVDWSASAFEATAAEPATLRAARDDDQAFDAGEPLPGARAEPEPKKAKKKKKSARNALPAHLLPVFTRELQVLLAAGLPMDRALRIVVEATADDRVAAAADALLSRVRSGSLLSEAMEDMPERFDEFLRMAVRAGEAGGALPEVLDQVATYQERGQRLARSVRTALIYPAILSFAAALSVILLLTVVVPQFEMLFRQSGQAPPFATQMVIGASVFLRDYGWILPATATFLWVVGRWRYADARRGQFLHRRALRLPLVGKVIAGVSVERFARALGTLLANGVALPDALGLVANAVPNRAIGAVVAGAVDRVKQGERLGDTLEEGGAMPLLAVQLVRVGEESGRLVEMLGRLADIYAQEVDTAVRRLTSMIEPILILVIGVIVGGIVLSLLSAIAGLNALAL